jgi:hypothetical protein
VNLEAPVEAANEPPDLLESGQMINFNRSFHDACPDSMSSADMNDARHKWLKSQGYVDSGGNGTSKAIPKAGWVKIRNQAIKFAEELGS